MATRPNPVTQPWQPAATAPKDGFAFIGCFGHPFAQIASWNSYDERWVVATLNLQQMRCLKFDAWFETESERPESLTKWMPLPDA